MSKRKSNRKSSWKKSFKKNIEKIISNTIEDKNFPSENDIRQIIKEEMEISHIKNECDKQSESAQLQSTGDKIIEFLSNKNNIGYLWLLVLYFPIGFGVGAFKVATTFSRFLFQNIFNLSVIDASVWGYGITSIILLVIFVVISIIIYDKIVKLNGRVANISTLLLILYWCDSLMPEISTWVERIV